MSLTLLFANSFSRLCRKPSVLNHNKSLGERSVNAKLPLTAKRNRPAGRSALDFDLLEAVRLHDLGWSYRKIARKMNNVSRETVRTRILEHEASIETAKPKPVQPPPVPAYKPPVPPVDSKSTEYVPNWTFAPPVQPSMRPPTPPEPGPPPLSAPPSVPVTNSIELGQYWALRGRPGFEPDMKQFFLVNGQKNTEFATGSAQLCVGLDEWHESYYNLDVFRHAERVWIILVPSEDNRKFLLSLIRDIRIREKCLVVRPTLTSNPVLHICQGAYHAIHGVSQWGASAAWAQFEQSYGFRPLPQPNHVREIESLLEPPLQPDRPQVIDGGYGVMRSDVDLRDAYFTPEEKRRIDSGDRRCGFAF